MPSLRSIIEHQMGSDARSQDRADERQWRTEQADLNRIETGEQKAADRVAKEDLKQIPTVQIFHKDGSTNAAASANASNAAQQYAGAATQVGVDRDGNPVYRLTKTGKLYGFDEEGKPREHEGIIAPKPAQMNAAERKAVHEASLGVQGVDDALAKLQDPNAKGATGPVNALPGSELVRQYTDKPEAIDARAAVSNIGSLKLHDRSGAAVTISEFPRLAPFIPKVSDSPVAAARKLENLKAEYQRMQDEWSGKTPAKKAEKPATAAGTRGMHKGKPVVMGADGEWHYE